jgi:maleylpyruvate isomerase
MKLYSYWRSSASYRARIVLHYKQIPFEYVAVDISRTQQQDTPEMIARNPMRQVPVLEWEEDGKLVYLTQSIAIAEYLEARYPTPALMPRDELERARVREAVQIVNAGIQPLQNLPVFKLVQRLGGEAAGAEWLKDVNVRGLTALERAAEQHGRGYLVGESITLADVCLVPQLVTAARFGVDLTSFPRLIAIAERAGAHPAFVAAEPKRQPEAPGDVA